MTHVHDQAPDPNEVVFNLETGKIRVDEFKKMSSRDLRQRIRTPTDCFSSSLPRIRVELDCRDSMDNTLRLWN